jgi:diacylglycerol kinase (ATP)
MASHSGLDVVFLMVRDNGQRMRAGSATLIAHMRAAAILGLGCSPKDLRPFQVHRTRDGEEIEWQIGLPAASDAADAILLFGGDGTIHRHLGPLVRLGLPVLVVPVGSGNDFARAIGLPRVRDSLAAWGKFCAGAGNIRTIDLGVIAEIEPDSGALEDLAPDRTPTSRAKDTREMGHPRKFVLDRARYFCCVAGVGLDAEVARQANSLPRWLRGHGGYALALIPTIFRFAPLPIKILKPEETDSTALQSADRDAKSTVISDQATILAAFANTPTYGGGMKIAPQAKMDDGLLDICVVSAVDPFMLFCLFPTVYSGRHLKIREVGYFHASRVRVETEHPLDVYADGEYVCRTPVDVGIHSAALQVIVRPSQTSL